MAYMSQDHKKQIAPVVKNILKQYGLKGSLSVRHHSTLVLTISKGSFEIEQDHASVNVHWIDTHYQNQPKIKECLTQLVAAMKGPEYFDKSDIMSDYFHCSHYVDIQFGKCNKPYIQVGV